MWIVLKIFFSSLWAVAGVICIISIPYIIRRNRKIFSSTLLSIMKDGTPLEEGLKVHYVDAPFTIKHVFRNIHKALCKGNPLWKSMMKHRFFLGKTAIRLIQSAEESGQLLEMVKVLDIIYAEDLRRYSEYRSARYYPYFLLYLFFLIMPIQILNIFFIVYISDELKEMFGEFKMATTIIERGFNITLCMGFVLLIVFLIFVFHAILRISGARLSVISYRIPFFGICDRDRNLSYFCRTCAALLKQLKTLPEVLKIASEAMPAHEYACFAAQAKKDLEKGRSLGQSIQNNILFPTTARWLIRSGELSGNLDENLERAANYYHNRFVERSLTIRGIMMPAIVIGGGVIVGTYGLVMFAMFRRLMDGLMGS